MLRCIAHRCAAHSTFPLTSFRASTANRSTSTSSAHFKMTSMQAHNRTNRLVQHLSGSSSSQIINSHHLQSFATASSSEPTCPPTADLCDNHSKTISLVQPTHTHDQWKQFGSVRSACGQAVTLKCLEDNTLVRSILEQTTDGDGKLLIIDGGGSRRCALLGDQLAALAVKHHWTGVVVNGYIRDSSIMSSMPLHIKAIGTNPIKSLKNKSTQGQSQIKISFDAAAGGVQISPGDWIYSDEDGILVSKTKLH